MTYRLIGVVRNKTDHKFGSTQYSFDRTTAMTNHHNNNKHDDKSSNRANQDEQQKPKKMINNNNNNNKNKNNGDWSVATAGNFTELYECFHLF